MGEFLYYLSPYGSRTARRLRQYAAAYLASHHGAGPTENYLLIVTILAFDPVEGGRHPITS